MLDVLPEAEDHHLAADFAEQVFGGGDWLAGGVVRRALPSVGDDQAFARVPSQDKGALVRNRATGSSLPARTKTGLEAHILGFGPSLT